MSNPLNVRVKRNSPEAIIPSYASPGAACFDIHVLVPGGKAEVPPGGSMAFDAGLSFEIPEGFVMQVFSRSGHGFKFDVSLSNGTGIIDSDYRGSLMVKLFNKGRSPLEVGHLDRVAQAMIVPIPRVVFEEADSLSSTDRGAGGFGSTGSS